MSVGIGAGAFMDGLVDGLKAGSDLSDARDKKKLKQQMQGLSAAEVMEQPDGTYALVGPGQQPGFFGRLMGKEPEAPVTYETFNAEPTRGLVDAARQGAMAKAYSSYGDDPYKGVLLDNYASDTRTEEIARITQTAIQSAMSTGDLAPIRDAYRLVDDGQDADFEMLEDGRARVFDPRSGQDIMVGAPQEVINHFANQLSPETVHALSVRELEMQQARQQITNGILQQRKYLQEINGTQPITPEQQRMLMVTQHATIEAAIARETALGREADPARLDQLNLQMTALEDMISGRAGLSGGSAGGGGGVQGHLKAATQGMMNDLGSATNGCASYASSLQKSLGFDVEQTRGAQDFANQLEKKGWQRVPVGEQQPGDVGVTADKGQGLPGADHVYTVLGLHSSDPNLLKIADNQNPSGGLRPIRGGGKTETEYFLRPPQMSPIAAPSSGQGLSYGERVVRQAEAADAAKAAQNAPSMWSEDVMGKDVYGPVKVGEARYYAAVGPDGQLVKREIPLAGAQQAQQVSGSLVRVNGGYKAQTADGLSDPEPGGVYTVNGRTVQYDPSDPERPFVLVE